MQIKLLRIILLIVIIFSCPLLCLSEQTDGPKWLFFSDNCFYDAKYTQSSDMLFIWTYFAVTDDFRKETIAELKKDDLKKSIRYRTYAYIISLNELDCKKRLFRIKEFMDCDHDGNILERIVSNDQSWESIKPRSSFDKLYQKVCVPAQKSLKKE